MWGDTPLPEVRAFHAEHHAHVRSPSDFSASIEPEGFDADEVARLAVSLGAGELIAVSRDLDDTPWWHGAHRGVVPHDVVGPVATAARAHGLAFGLAHLACDDAPAEVAELVQQQIPDSIRALWATPPGDGSWVAPPTWATTGTVDRRLPTTQPMGTWEIRAGVGSSLGWNRSEIPSNQRSAADLISTLVTTIALGGRMVIDLGIRPDGSIAPEQRSILGVAAPWLRSHSADLADCVPLDIGTDDSMIALVKSGAVTTQSRIIIVDLAAKPKRSIAQLSTDRFVIDAVAGADSWRQDTAGVHLEAPARAASISSRPLPALYSFDATARRAANLPLRSRRRPGAVRIGDEKFPTITAALRSATSGQIVVVGPGRYGPETETFPLVVPAGVTLSGPRPIRRPSALGLARSNPPMSDIVGGGLLVVAGGDGASIAQLRIFDETTSRARDPVVAVAGFAGVTIEACEISGHVTISNADRAALRWNRLPNCRVAISMSIHIEFIGNHVSALEGETALYVDSCDYAKIDANSIYDTALGIRIDGGRGMQLNSNAVTARHTAIHLRSASHATLTASRLRSMRGVHIEGGDDIDIAASAIELADTAILVDGAARDVHVRDSYVAAARVGMQIVAPSSVDLHNNRLAACRDHEVLGRVGI